ncbi:MAG TPA: hypothetical protein VF095_09310 [Bacillota bacterium]
MGEREEREELLAAVIFDITEKQVVPKKDIKEIYVIKHSDGVYPFNYEVVLELKNGTRTVYQWENENKTKVMISSS